MVTRSMGLRVAAAVVGVGILAGCEEDANFDRFGGAGQVAPAGQIRPEPDGRGVISYTSYEVVVAGRDETVRGIAVRLGQDANTMARLNGIGADVPLRSGEVLLLPDPAVQGLDGDIVAGPIEPRASIDIESIASTAIDDAERRAPARQPAADEPRRHRVGPGETAQSIARAYRVSVRSLSDWNGLGPDNQVREGQVLLIPEPTPVVTPRMAPERRAAAPAPSAAPEPQPAEPAAPARAAGDRGGLLMMPVQGSIARTFTKGQSDGLDIAAVAGSPVVAAGAGTVAAITRDTAGVPILVIRHADGLLTVYAGIDNLSVEKNDTVRRGQQVAVVRAGNPAILHFETRKGFESVDPMQYLN